MKFLSPLALLTLCSVLAAPLMAAEEIPELTGCAAKNRASSTRSNWPRATATPISRPDWREP